MCTLYFFDLFSVVFLLWFEIFVRVNLKDLFHDILSLFCDGKNYHQIALKPKKNYLLRTEKNTKQVIRNQKGTRMVKDGED